MPEYEEKANPLDYAMSVILSRALPDVRDGLKTANRRLLYAMHESIKLCRSAHIINFTVDKYHPYDNSALYDELVNMAQHLSFRYPMVNGQGNFGTIDGDPPAHMHFTEAKISHLGEEMFKTLNKKTVDFIPNFDKSSEEPEVLPAVIPNLLINGAAAEAAGISTYIPPHNLNEICNAICAQIDNPDITIDELMNFVHGPDFPTGGTIVGRSGIHDAYKTGRGKILLRANYHEKTKKSGNVSLIFEEVPYSVDIVSLLKEVKKLIQDKSIDGIAKIENKSDRDGIQIIFKLKKNAKIETVLDQLYSKTQLQISFDIINLVLVDGKPQCLNLKELIHHYIEHRKKVIARSILYDLHNAEECTYDQVKQFISTDEAKLEEFIKNELKTIADKFGDERRTNITDKQLQLPQSIDGELVVDLHTPVGISVFKKFVRGDFLR